MITAIRESVTNEGRFLKIGLLYSNGDRETIDFNYRDITSVEQITSEISRRVQNKNALVSFINDFSNTVYSPIIPVDIGRRSDKDKALSDEKEYLKTKAMEYIYGNATVVRVDLIAYCEAQRTSTGVTELINADNLLTRYIDDCYALWVIIDPQTGAIKPCNALDTGAQRLISAPDFDVFVATVKAVDPTVLTSLEL